MSGTTTDELVVATSAAAGQVVSVFCVFPLDVVKTRLQVTSGRDVKSAEAVLPALLRIVREEGLLSVWAKFPAKGLQQGVTRFTYYFIYRWLSNRFKSFVGGDSKYQLGFWANLAIGYLAGLMNTVFLSPLETLATRVMASHTQVTMLEAAREVLKHHGIRGFYYGQPVATMCISGNPALQNTLFDQARLAMLRGRDALSFAEAFWLGVVAKAVATVMTYPASRAVSMLQNTPNEARKGGGSGSGDGSGGGRTDKPGSAGAAVGDKGDGGDDGGGVSASAERPPSDAPRQVERTVPGEIAAVYREGGVEALYSGLQATLAKGVLQSGVMLMVKERVDFATRLAFGMAGDVK